MKTALSRAKRRVVRHLGPSALVLTYHRVTKLERDTQLLSVCPEHFAEQIELLARRYRVISLFDLMSEVRTGNLVDGTVALTFDDGYADNLLEAAPLLETARVPATVFVSSGYMQSGREFWWDELERLLLEGPLPECKHVLKVKGSRLVIELSASEAPCDSGWTVLRPSTCTAARLYLRVSEFLRPLQAPERERCLDELARCLGKDRDTRPSHRPLSTDEVAVLDDSPWVEIGGHTTHHEVLSHLSVHSQNAVITEDKAELERICGREMRLFSYPFGGREDFTQQTTALVRDAGYAGAVANSPGFVKKSTDIYGVPRLVVRDCTGDELANRLNEWLPR